MKKIALRFTQAIHSGKNLRMLILATLAGTMVFTMTSAFSQAASEKGHSDRSERPELRFADPDAVNLEAGEIPAQFLIPQSVPDPAAVEALKTSNLRFWLDRQPKALKDVQVSASLSPANDHSESQLAADPNNPLHMVGGSKFFTEPANYIFRDGSYTTFDGGKTWLQQVVPGYEKWTITSDPVVTIDDQGNAYYAVLAANKTVNGCRTTYQGSGMFVSTSRDGGITWDDPATVHLTTGSGLGDDKQWIAADSQPKSPYRGNVYIVWDLFVEESGVAFSRSTDRGKAFEPYKFLGGFDDAFLGPQVDIAPNGDIYVVWDNFSNNSIEWVKSTDGGVTFTKPAHAVSMVPMPGVLSNGTWRNVTLATFAISPTTGTLVLAWADARNGDTDIYFARSADGGQTWTSGALLAGGRVNDDPIKDGIDQFQPALAVSRTGEVGIAWYDRRLSKNTTIDVSQAISTDDGNTFQPNTRVTSASFDGNVNPAYPKSGSCSLTFIGDYFGMAAGAEGFYPFWADTRTGVQEIFSVNSTGVAQTEELVYTNNLPVRDLAFDAKGVLHFSEIIASAQQSLGRINQLTSVATAPAKALRQNVDPNQIGGSWAGNFAFDANGTLFISNGAQPGVIYSLANDTLSSFFTIPTSPINGLQLRDSQLYFTSTPNSIFTLSLPLDPSQPTASLVYSNPIHGSISDLALSANEIYFIDSSEETGSIYKLVDSQETKFFTRLKGAIRGLTIGPDGRLWFASENKIFRVNLAITKPANK
ncbi:exo-alpha-sialidase [Candidatus Acetothermia bacterium]|nr:exo-alpha-sialidase [Candidatus Acetothermia bacterium]